MTSRMLRHARTVASKSHRAAIGWLLAAALAAIVPLVGAEAQTQAGAVATLKGEAAAEGTAARRALNQGATVYVDETISTGAGTRLTLSLGRNTTIKLGENARMKLDRHMVNAGGAFDLQAGPVLFNRGTGGPKGDTQVRSPYGLLAVRGTKFFAGPSNGVFGVLVLRGRVDVTGGGKTVRLTPGLGTNIAKPGDAPTAPGAWKPPRVKAALESVQ